MSEMRYAEDKRT